MKRLALLPVTLLIVAVAVLQAQPPVPRPNPNNPPNPAPNINPPNSPPQTPPSTNPLQPSAQPNTGVSLTVRRSKQLIGSRVALTGGTSVGVVDDIVFTDEGCIDYLVVIDQGR